MGCKPYLWESSYMALNRNIIAGILLFGSLILLFPGISKPIFNIQLNTGVDAKLGKFNAKIFDKSRSILGTVKDLYDGNTKFVAVMIFFFSVVVPLIKACFMFFLLLSKNREIKKRIYEFIKVLGKWSMADVFVVGIFLAFLSTRDQVGTSMKQLQILGFNLNVEITAVMDSSLGPGFYYFTGYCLTSLLSIQVYKFTSNNSLEPKVLNA